MKVGTHLDGAIAEVSDLDCCSPSTGIGDYRIACKEIFTGNHSAPPCCALLLPVPSRAARQTQTLTNGAMHGNQLGAVGESTFHLHISYHLGHSLHHIFPAQNCCAALNQFRYRLAVSDAFE